MTGHWKIVLPDAPDRRHQCRQVAGQGVL